MVEQDLPKVPMTLIDAEAALVEIVRLIELSRHFEALDLCDDTEAAFMRLGRLDRLPTVAQRRMMVYPLIGRLDEAIRGNRELVDQYLNSGDAVAAAKVQTNLGFNLAQAGDKEAAVSQYRNAGRIFRANHRSYEQATCYMNLGIELMDRRPRVSKAYVTAARDLFAVSGHDTKVGDCVLLLARHADREGDPSRADRLRLEVEATYQRLGDQVRTAHVWYLMGSAAGRRGEYESADEFLSQALRVYLTRRPPTNLELADCARRLAMSKRALNDAKGAWPFALLAMVVANETKTSLREFRLRRTATVRRASVYNLALDLGLMLDQPEAVWALIEATRAQQQPTPRPNAHSDSARGRSGQHDGSSTGDVMGFEPLPGFEVHGHNPLDPQAVLRECVDRLTIRAEEVSLVLRTPEPVMSLDKLAETLGGPKGLWWSTVVVGDELFWASHRDGTTSAGVDDFGPESRARKAVDRVLSGLPIADSPSRGDFRRQSAQWRPGGTYDLALAELSALLPCVAAGDGRPGPHGAARFVTVWSPARELARLPIGLIPVESSGRRFLQHSALVYCPSPALAATRYLPPTIEPAGLSHLRGGMSEATHAVAGAIIDPLGDLPSSRVLGRRALEIVGSRSSAWQLRRPPEATRGHVSALLNTVANRTGTSSVLVVAAHTTPGLEDDPLAASILLKDGPLTARELLTPDGRKHYPLPPRVLFASCSSAGLTTPDWAGLTAAASWLGTTSAIASLWSLTTSVAAARFDLKVLEAVTEPDVAQALRDLQEQELVGWFKSQHRRIPYRKRRRDPRIWTAYVLLAV